ncbi:U6 snRNA phosphodiesterase Usb1 [Xylaria venustula]|nr:U6 snRNA phosphodiesterase Usb1 [Xylaria venustula]
MGLVDYSDSDESEDTIKPPTKKQKTSSSNQTIPLPPLPSAFHDLYASTVRVSASDDPTLHQGRKRVNPHKVGHWPSHLYIEWHPTSEERNVLTTLLSNLQANLTSSPSFSSPPIPITSFLTSDLGAPQPLHISLSRPIVLSTAQKDTFLTSLESSIRTSGVSPFELSPTGLEWHRTEESARSFLVLRVRSREAPLKKKREADTSNHHHNNDGQNTEGENESKGGAGAKAARIDSNKPANPQLTSLLDRANALVTAYGQPALYAFARNPNQESSKDKDKHEEDGESQVVDTAKNKNKNKNKTSSKNNNERGSVSDAPADAFHISIAWSFAPPTAELRRLTEEAFVSSADDNNSEKISSLGNGDGDGDGVSTENTTGTTDTKLGDAVRAMCVPVDGIKAKIGNIVTHIPLPDARNRWHGDSSKGGSRGLFGI